MGTTPLRGEALAAHLARGARRAGVVANVVGAVVVFLLTTLVAADGDQVPSGRWPELVAVFVAVIGVLFGGLTWGLNRQAEPFLDALAEDRPLVGEARRAALENPWRNAVWSLSGWAAAAVFFGVYTVVRLGSDAAGGARLGLTIVLGGLTTMGAVYLMNERVMRPAFAQAFRDEAPGVVRGIGVARRMLLTWALGAAVPSVLIVVGSWGEDATLADVRRVVVVGAAVALTVGWVITLRAARSVAEPLSGLRLTAARVAEGDLGAEVEVDDATEVGLLQAGFNEMVAGLREREQIRDLFGRHVGDEVARHALERGVELGGEVREATALFVDLTGSTTLAATRPPQEIVALLNEFFAAVVRAAEDHGGWVNKFEGDAALCVFGVPVERADHAARGLAAALALRDALDRVRERYPELDAGIGVSSGRVVAGNVGAEHRYEYTIIGDPVNEAARLTDEAKGRPSRVLASERAVTAAAATGSGGGDWARAAEIHLRGRSEPTIAFEPASQA